MKKDTPLSSLWAELRQDAEAESKKEAVLKPFLKAMILDHATFQQALAFVLGRRLGVLDDNEAALRAVCEEAFAKDPAILERVNKDIRASRDRDPACRSWLQPFLYYKGFAALEAHRVGHWLWGQGRETLALHLQSLCSQVFQVDIHPAARLGSGLFIDHATGVVIGETSVVEDDVSILQSVTLGGNGKERGDRHPKIGRGVLISVGAKVLGNIRVGEEARIAASSVVLKDVPAHATVAGVPAKLVRGLSQEHPAESMDHSLKS